MAAQFDNILDLDGALTANSIPKSLLSFVEQRVTGRAIFNHGQRRVDLALIEGQIVQAASNNPDNRLGEFLLRQGKIRFQDYLDSVDALLETGQRQGDFLREQSRLEKNELKNAILEHARAVIFELLDWDEGQYTLKLGPASDDPVQLQTSTRELILRGLAACTRFSKIRDALAPWSRVCAINKNIDPDEARRIRLKEEEAAIINLVDGHSRISEIIKTAPMADFRAMQMLYALSGAGIVEILE